MTREDVLAVLDRRRVAIERRDMTALGELYVRAARLDSPLAGSVQGPDAIVRSVGDFFAAFPDAVIVEDPAIVDGDRAAIVAEVTGTHVGAFMGLAPTGRAFRFWIVFAFTLDGGRIAHERRIYDFTGLLVQIGVLKAKPA